jgi:hypothetical protein
VAVLLLSVLSFTGCRSRAGKSSSSEATAMVLEASEARDYARVQCLADSLGKAGKLSKGESYYWQGYANYHLGQNELAEYFWEEAIRLSEHADDPNDLAYYAKSGNRLASLLCRLGEYASALHQTLPVINRLEKMQCDTTSDYTNLLIFAGCSKTFFNKEDSTATEMLERAYQMHLSNIHQKASKDAYRDAVAGIINVAYIWILVRGYEEGLFWTERLGNLVKESIGLFGNDKSYNDKQWARYKIFQAISLEGVGRHQEAEKAYEEYLQTQFSGTMEGLTNASDYLTVAQRWDEAVASYRSIMEYLQKELNIYSLDNIHRYLLKKYHAYQMLHQQDSTNLTARQICDVLDSAIINNRRLDASELHSILVRDMEIVEAEARSARQRQIYTDFVRANRINFSARDGWNMFLRACVRQRNGREALKAYMKQREIARAGKGKLDLLWQLINEHSQERILIFTADNQTAYQIGQRFRLPVLTHHTKIAERRSLLDAFRKGDLPVLVTSKILNEGVDVPEASVGIVVSGSGSIREHVQRLGRILRPAAGKQAVLYELISAGTSESYVSERRRHHRAYERPDSM